jgi:hypothetical protein
MESEKRHIDIISKFGSNFLFVTRIFGECKIAFKYNWFRNKDGNLIAHEAGLTSGCGDTLARNSSVACGFLLNP